MKCSLAAIGIILVLVAAVVFVAAATQSYRDQERQAEIDQLTKELDSIHKRLATAYFTESKQIQDITDRVANMEILITNYVLPKVERNSAFVDNYYLTN